ncbi:DUF1793-domain-containing protein [Meredithblackwellia eburnea MCA 4105]
MRATLAVGAGLLGSSLAAVTWQTTPFNPTAIPLAVRSPYVSTWLFAGERDGDLTTVEPLFWNGQPTPWCGLVRVDGVAYRWMGDGNCGTATQGVQRSMTFTASSTTFVITTGPVNVTAVFLSPNTPTDLVRQSLPYSYLTVTAASNDGNSHDVYIYSDIGAAWINPDYSTLVDWSTGTDNNIIRHQAEMTNQTVYGENDEFTTIGQVVHALASGSGVTWQTGTGTDIRATFVSTGTLPNTQDSNFRAISNNTAAFAFSSHVGTVASNGTPSSKVVTVVGHYRDPAIQWAGLGGTYPDRSLYFQTQHPGLIPSLTFFYNDYANAVSSSAAFDSALQSAGTSVASAKYAGLAALAVRQVYGGLEITVGKQSSTAYNSSDILAWTKEIATSDYISTVDVTYPAAWFFAYANPNMIRYLIEPVLQYQAKGLYPQPYALHDFGKYPIAGEANPDSYILEETGNMMILAYAHSKLTGSTNLIQTYYSTLLGWANELVQQTAYPVSQVSTDDFEGAEANYTNLAIKGVCGLQSMSKMAAMVGNPADAQNFSAIATSYTAIIIKNGLSSNGSHFKVTYQSNDSTWITPYNMFPDKALGLGLFQDSLYSSLAAFYPKVSQPYGIPLDSRSTTTKTDWSILTAGLVLDAPSTVDLFVSGVVNFLSGAFDFRPLPDRYDALTGAVIFYKFS